MGALAVRPSAAAAVAALVVGVLLLLVRVEQQRHESGLVWTALCLSGLGMAGLAVVFRREEA